MAGFDNSTTATAPDPLGRSKVEIGFELCFALIICLVSIFGNFLVVVVINKDHRLKNITNSFIHNLAWTDICTATLNMPFWMISLYTGRWIFSKTLCEWISAVLTTSAVASVMNMGLIAVNRYLKVVKPNLYPKFFPNKRTARIYCAAVWLITALLSTPPLYGWGKFAYHKGFCVCTILYEIEQISYAICVAGIAVNSVTCVIIVCYYKIYRTVKASSANMSYHAAEGNVSSTSSSDACPATDIKVLKATFTVVCVYMLCWIPVTMVALSEVLFGPPPRLVSIVVIYLMYCSSGANPVIYGMMNPQFKAAFAKALKYKVNVEDSQRRQRISAKVTGSTSANQEPMAVQPALICLR